MFAVLFGEGVIAKLFADLQLIVVPVFVEAVRVLLRV